jgi:Tol biopolymer transport system component
MRWKIMPLLPLFAIAIAAPGFAAKDDAGHTERILFNEGGALYVMDRNGEHRQKLAEGVRVAALSADARLAAYDDDKVVAVVSIPDGNSAIVTTINEGRVDNVAWSPDGKHIVYNAGIRGKTSDLFVVSYPVGGVPRNLGHWSEGVSFSPDGKFIVHSGWRSGPNQSGSTVEVVDVETGKREELYASNEMIGDARYSPDGSQIAFLMTSPDDTSGSDDDGPDCGGADYDLWVLPKNSGKPFKVIEHVYDFDWSPDGQSVAAGTGTQDCGYPPGDGAVLFSSIDKKVQFKISRKTPALRPTFSPDGKSVVFVDFNNSRLMIYDLATRNLAEMSAAKSIGYDKVYDWK